MSKGERARTLGFESEAPGPSSSTAAPARSIPQRLDALEATMHGIEASAQGMMTMLIELFIAGDDDHADRVVHVHLPWEAHSRTTYISSCWLLCLCCPPTPTVTLEDEDEDDDDEETEDFGNGEEFDENEEFGEDVESDNE
ncbi:unnamed protein product [Ilex paraguariensis]|uniref:Uncharacterized protein n=1 Tax=Ilex paraguariensis TaxID=185542 RepID=A0ABC8SJ00_9AQUA